MSNETWPAHSMATATVDSMKRWKRKPSDVYPTPYEATCALIRWHAPPVDATILEPACGNGAISRALKALGREVDSSDLRHTGYGQGGIDFLADDTPAGAIITNPPFSLAADFIRHACKRAPYVALLLKSNYWHTAGRLTLFDNYPPNGIYPVSWRLAFLAEERGTSPLMDCTWFVWVRGKPWTRHAPLRRPAKDAMPQVEPAPLTSKMADFGEAVSALTEAYRGR